MKKNESEALLAEITNICNQGYRTQTTTQFALLGIRSQMFHFCLSADDLPLTNLCHFVH